MTSERGAAIDVYVALGSNLGDRDAHLDAACESLAALSDGEQTLIVSSRLQTAAVAPDERADEVQPDYLNAAARFMTNLSPEALLDELQRIERERGREREGVPRWSARPLDLDLLVYGDRCLNTPRLTLPHPLITQREFVLQPLLEIAPDLAIPGTGLSVTEALRALRAGTPATTAPRAGDAQ